MSKHWTIKDMPDQAGRIVVVTGANSGLGYETTLAFAQKNATVVMACRNLKKGAEARDEVLAQFPNATLDLMELDLGSLASVRSFAEAFHANYSQLDLLINNAGIMAVPRSETVDGFETQFGVNHLGHFALTGLLLPKLLSTPGSRVVSVSSIASYGADIKFDDIMHEQGYARYMMYGQTKLANVLFANELQRRLATAGANTISVSAHPGVSNTNLQSTTVGHSGNPFERVIYGMIVMPLLSQSQAQGTLPQLYAATAADVNGCDFIGPDFMRLRGYPKKEQADAKAYDESIAQRLWEVSVELTGVDYAELAQATPA